MTEPTGKVKGAPVRALLEFRERSIGHEQVEALIESLSERARAELRIDPRAPGFGILASAWYRTSTCAELIAAIERSVPPRERERFWLRAPEAIMAATLSGVHKAIFRVVGSPSLMRDYCQTFWNRQFDDGRVRVFDLEPGVQRHEYHDWGGHDRLMCKITFLCLAPMFRAMGEKNTRVELEQCVSTGAPHCSATIHWTPR